jgi:hypothetical protein
MEEYQTNYLDRRNELFCTIRTSRAHKRITTLRKKVTARGGLRVCGVLCQCSVQGPKALKNMVWGGVSWTLHYTLESIKTGSGKHIVFFHLKVLGPLHNLMLDKLR